MPSHALCHTPSLHRPEVQRSAALRARPQRRHQALRGAELPRSSSGRLSLGALLGITFAAGRSPSDGDQVRAGLADGFVRWPQDPYILPHDLCVSEGRPAVVVALRQKLRHRAAYRRDKEQVAAHTVIEGDRRTVTTTAHTATAVTATAHAARPAHLPEEARLGLPVPPELGRLAIEAADSIRSGAVHVPAQVLLHGMRRRPVALWRHELLVAKLNAASYLWQTHSYRPCPHRGDREHGVSHHHS
eukprot:scaffold50136_cov64-Phaeocystis_antarctica.AAC.2